MEKDKDKRTHNKEYDMRLLIGGIILIFVGIFSLLFIPYPLQIYGVNIIFRDLAPVMFIIGIIGVIVGYFVRV